MLLLVLAAACKAETVDDSRGADEPARTAGLDDDEQRQSTEKIGITCKPVDDVDDPTRGAVEAQARAVYGMVRQGRFGEVWDTLHPQARREDQRKPFVAALEAMRARLQEVEGEPSVDSLYVVDVRGGVNDLARVTCEDQEDASESFTMITNVGDEDLAVVTLLASSDVFGHAATIQLRERGNAWRLVGIQVNPAIYKRKSASQWEAIADRHRRANKPVPAYLALGVAQALSSRGAAVKTVVKERIDDKLEALGKDQLLAAHTETWTIDEKRYDIQGLSLASTRTDISPVVKYVSPGGLVREMLEHEADELVEHVRSAYPELTEQFDAVVFEAYAEPPTTPGKSYDAYRVARFLDPRQSPTEG